MSEVTEAIKDTLQYAMGMEQKPPAAVQQTEAQKPSVDAGENAEAEYADMPYWELLHKIEKGEITDPAAAKIYLQKVKEAEILTVRNVAAKHSEDKTNWLDAAVTDIQAKYDPLIRGTHQDRARYFASKAEFILSNRHWKKPEDIARSSRQVGNLFTYAGILARQETQPQGAKPAEQQHAAKLQTVRAELAQVQTRK